MLHYNLSDQFLEKFYMELHQVSSQFLDDFFTKYDKEYTITPTSHLAPELVGKFVFHMYPERDTRTSDGELDGYYDSLFFTLVVYDVERKLKYIITGRDQLVINVPLACRMFKDGSTVFFSSKPVKLKLFQSVDVDEA